MAVPAVESLQEDLKRHIQDIERWEDKIKRALADIRVAQDCLTNSHCFVNHYTLAIEALEKRFDIHGEESKAFEGSRQEDQGGR